jgi:hypothetical protein
MPGLLEFTRMTGDLVKAMRACPQPIVAAVDGVCAGRRRDPRHGLGPPPRNARREDRFPVHPGRPRRLRHGRLRDPAADHRPGPGGGTALHRPLHDRRGRRTLGLLQPHRRAGAAARAGARPRPRAGRRPDLRPFDHQDPAQPGMGVSLETAIEMEAQAQAICMATNDFRRAYEAFAAKRTPEFKGD